MIYLISFIESFCSGLTGVNLTLYLKYILHFTEAESGYFLSAFGLISSVLVLLLGPMVDKYGIKKCAIAGSALLVLSRLGLGLTTTPSLAILYFLLASFGSAIKSSSILIFLKHYKKSFKIDYLVFNFAFFFAGIFYDEFREYQSIYIISGLVNAINLLLLLKLEAPKLDLPTPKPINWQTFRTIVTYNFMVLPVSCIFTWMNSGLPKWILQVLGPDAPVGKLYGSFNPFIILFTLPLVKLIQKDNRNVLTHIMLGSLLSALAMFVVGLPGDYYWTLLASILLFTIGEAIWSPANMEYGTLLCPEGEEGRYMTVSLIPNTLGKVLMGYLISFSMQNYVYGTSPDYSMPFYLMGGLALLTPISLFLTRNKNPQVSLPRGPEQQL